MRRRMINYDSSPPSITYTDNDGQNTAVTTHTFTSKAIGAAHPTRRVIVTVAYFAASATCTATVAGISATEITGAARNNGNARLRMFIADFPAGTTATVVITQGAAGPCYIGVYSALNLLSAIATDATTDGVAYPMSLSVSDRGVAVGMAYIDAIGGSWLWGGLTEVFDAAPAATYSGATYTATTPTTLSITAVPSRGGTSARIAASFR